MSHDRRSALLWDVLLGEATWHDALASISASTGQSAVFLVHGVPGAVYEGRTYNVDTAAWAEPNGLADLMDPVRSQIAACMQRASEGAVFDRREIVSDAAYERTQIWETLRQQDIYHGLISKPLDSSSSIAGFWIGLPRRRGDDCRRVWSDFAAWIGPLRRALRTQSMLGDVADPTRGFTDALSRFRLGAIMIDPQLRIRQANPEAERILELGDGIASRLGRLIIVAPAARHELLRRVAGLWRAPPPESNIQLRASRPSGLPDYILEVVPARSPGGAATVLVSDPMAANPPLDLQQIKLRFGLTPGEARVAQLVQLALSKRQIAQHLGLSENTVKFHLASVRMKAGARNMVELALVLQQPWLARRAESPDELSA